MPIIRKTGDPTVQHAATEARLIDELCLRIDADKLCSRVSKLKEHIPCTVDLSRKSLSTLMGTQNCHVEVILAGDVKWLALAKSVIGYFKAKLPR
jgi:hypothetical protein